LGDTSGETVSVSSTTSEAIPSVCTIVIDTVQEGRKVMVMIERNAIGMIIVSFFMCLILQLVSFTLFTLIHVPLSCSNFWIY